MFVGFARCRTTKQAVEKCEAIANTRDIDTFDKPEIGDWTISLVHMRSINSVEADYESYWANLTFGLL